MVRQEKRGLVSGIIVFGFGFGSAFLAPMAAYFIELYGWRTTLLALGAGFGTIIISASQFLKNPPAGWTPHGWTPPENNPATASTLDFTPLEMIKTRAFALMFLTYALAMVAGMMTIGHLAAFAKDLGHTVLQASFSITILALGNGLGRVALGAASDRLGRKNTLPFIFVLIGLAMLALPYSGTLLALYSSAFVVGLCFGGFLVVYPPATADFFGTRNFGINYGLVFLGYGTGCFLGPWLGGAVFDLTGSYTIAFSIAGVLSLIGAAVCLFIRHPAVV